MLSGPVHVSSPLRVSASVGLVATICGDATRGARRRRTLPWVRLRDALRPRVTLNGRPGPPPPHPPLDAPLTGRGRPRPAPTVALRPRTRFPPHAPPPTASKSYLFLGLTNLSKTKRRRAREIEGQETSVNTRAPCVGPPAPEPQVDVHPTRDRPNKRADPLVSGLALEAWDDARRERDL